MMAFSKSWGYGVRALVHMAAAEDPEKRWQSGELAGETGLPASYLSKVLSAMAGEGLLDSQRGRGGGVKLARAPQQIKLSDIAAATDDIPGDDPSMDAMDGAPQTLTDALGARWQPYRRGLVEYLATTTVADLL